MRNNLEEKIKEKLEELSKQKEQTLAQLNAILGAEQALHALLETKETKEEK